MRDHHERPRRVLRGGSWNNTPGNLRSADRGRNNADYRSRNVGFRLVYREPPANDRRVLRGGSWANKPEYLRSASRDGDNADNRYEFLGFRLVYRSE